MFSRKQFWRKANAKILTISQLSNRVERQIDRVIADEIDEQQQSTSPLEECNSTDYFVALKTAKSVRFSSTVCVVLIPTREELSMYSTRLYWADQDYGVFKRNAVDEIREYVSIHGVTAKEAIKALYQPDLNADYQEDFYESEACYVNRCPSLAEKFSASADMAETADGTSGTRASLKKYNEVYQDSANITKVLKQQTPPLPSQPSSAASFLRAFLTSNLKNKTNVEDDPSYGSTSSESSSSSSPKISPQSNSFEEDQSNSTTSMEIPTIDHRISNSHNSTSTSANTLPSTYHHSSHTSSTSYSNGTVPSTLLDPLPFITHAKTDVELNHILESNSTTTWSTTTTPSSLPSIIPTKHTVVSINTHLPSGTYSNKGLEPTSSPTTVAYEYSPKSTVPFDKDMDNLPQRSYSTSPPTSGRRVVPLHTPSHGSGNINSPSKNIFDSSHANNNVWAVQWKKTSASSSSSSSLNYN